MGLRDVLLSGALHPSVSSAAFKKRLVTSGEITENDVADPYVLAELGRVVLLQNLLPEDISCGVRLLSKALELAGGSGLSRRAKRTLIQYHVVNGNARHAEHLLDMNPDLDEAFFGYLRGELRNPFKLKSTARLEDWLAAFNRPFISHGLQPVQLVDSTRLRPFDRLTAWTPECQIWEQGEEPLVSVVLTVYKPDEQRLLTSIRSILAQSWTRFELLIVDDNSGPEFQEIFEGVAALDSRIEIISLRENRGTYAARNIGYAASSGDFITGQDDDDWSHPERIARQMAFLRDNPTAIGCRVSAIRCDENLGRVRLGYSPEGQNASSLLIRREGYQKVGGFLEARKAADTEYYYRLMKATGRPITDLEEPLSVIRILDGSLSRADFSPGWKHSSRRSFRSAYEHWHSHVENAALHVTPDRHYPVTVPHRFQITPSARQEFDVVVAGEWEGSGCAQRAMLDEVDALMKADYRVAVLNLESERTLRIEEQVPLNKQVQELINEGSIHEVFYDDEAYAKLLILSSPSVLEFLPHGPSAMSVGSMLVIANESPYGKDENSLRYLPANSHANAEASFGVAPIWLPRDEYLRSLLDAHISSECLYEWDWPGIVDLSRWHNRLYYRSVRPVVGRAVRGATSEWPRLGKTIEEVYPVDGRYDIRVIGKIQNVLNDFGGRRAPEAWTVYQDEELQIQRFLDSLDYYVFFPDERTRELPLWHMLDVLSSGTILILPRRFRHVFGEAALYGEPDEVGDIIRHLHSDFSIYEAQLARTKAVLSNRFSHKAFARLVSTLLR